MLKAVLVRNELAKLMGKRSSWVMLAMLPLLTIAAGLLAKQSGDEDLANGNVWEFVRLGLHAVPSLTDLATMFAIIAAGSSVAAEFASGTVKLLLIRPYSRSEVLMAKYAAVMLLGLAMTLLVLISAFLTGGLLFGIDGGSTLYHGISFSSFVLRAAAFNFIELVVLTTLAFMLSTVTRHNAAAIGLTLFLLLAGPQFAYMVRDYAWAKYTLFANIDLIDYTMGRPFRDGMTIGFSGAVLAVHVAGFILLAWIVFRKRDVAG